MVLRGSGHMFLAVGVIRFVKIWHTYRSSLSDSESFHESHCGHLQNLSSKGRVRMISAPHPEDLGGTPQGFLNKSETEDMEVCLCSLHASKPHIRAGRPAVFDNGSATRDKLKPVSTNEIPTLFATECYRCHSLSHLCQELFRNHKD
eukprot:5962506-Amphidinium_carterae.2